MLQPDRLVPAILDPRLHQDPAGRDHRDPGERHRRPGGDRGRQRPGQEDQRQDPAADADRDPHQQRAEGVRRRDRPRRLPLRPRRRGRDEQLGPVFVQPPYAGRHVRREHGLHRHLLSRPSVLSVAGASSLRDRPAPVRDRTRTVGPGRSRSRSRPRAVPGTRSGSPWLTSAAIWPLCRSAHSSAVSPVSCSAYASVSIASATPRTYANTVIAAYSASLLSTRRERAQDGIGVRQQVRQQLRPAEADRARQPQMPPVRRPLRPGHRGDPVPPTVRRLRSAGTRPSRCRPSAAPARPCRRRTGTAPSSTPRARPRSAASTTRPALRRPRSRSPSAPPRRDGDPGRRPPAAARWRGRRDRVAERGGGPTTVPTPGLACTSRSCCSACNAFVAVAIATPKSRTSARVDGTRSPGFSSPASIRRRSSAAITWYGASPINPPELVRIHGTRTSPPSHRFVSRWAPCCANST